MYINKQNRSCSRIANWCNFTAVPVRARNWFLQTRKRIHFQNCCRITPICNTTTGPLLFVNIHLPPQLNQSCGPGAPVISGACCSTKCVHFQLSKSSGFEHFLHFMLSHQNFLKLLLSIQLSVLVRF